MEPQNVSVRFKYGIHTFYLFVDLTAPMQDVKTEILEALSERYPDGLKPSVGAAPSLKVADAERGFMVLGALAVPNDAYAGWKKLNFSLDDTAGKVGLKQNSIVAFNFVDAESVDEPQFVVEWPKEEPETVLDDDPVGGDKYEGEQSNEEDRVSAENFP